MNIDQISGLITIDLWESGPNGEIFASEQNQWLDELSNKLAQHAWDSIINSSYHTKIDYDDPSIYNTLRCYNWSNYDPVVMTELIKQCNNYIMSKHIIQRVFAKQAFQAFALYSIDSFLKHCTTMVPTVKSWLVVGQSWGVCTHWRSIGLISLCKIAEQHGFSIYGTPWGFLNIDQKNCTVVYDFLNDRDISWTQVGDDLFQAKLKTNQKGNNLPNDYKKFKLDITVT